MVAVQARFCFPDLKTLVTTAGHKETTLSTPRTHPHSIVLLRPCANTAIDNISSTELRPKKR